MSAKDLRMKQDAARKQSVPNMILQRQSLGNSLPGIGALGSQTQKSPTDDTYFHIITDGMVCTPVEGAIFECLSKIGRISQSALRAEDTLYELSIEADRQNRNIRIADEGIEVYKKMMEALFKQVDDVDALRERLVKVTQNHEKSADIIDAAIFGSMGK